MAPGATAGVSAAAPPVPQEAQLLGRVLGGRQHVQVTLLLTQPAGVLRGGEGRGGEVGGVEVRGGGHVNEH